jgi:hypothetical protein
MRNSGWTPSIVPRDDDQNVYIVLDDFGRTGRAYRETDVERTDLEAVIMDTLEGQKPGPRDRLQHRRGLVAGCLCRCRARAATPL